MVSTQGFCRFCWLCISPGRALVGKFTTNEFISFVFITEESLGLGAGCLASSFRSLRDYRRHAYSFSAAAAVFCLMAPCRTLLLFATAFALTLRARPEMRAKGGLLAVGAMCGVQSKLKSYSNPPFVNAFFSCCLIYK